jgi:phosphate:Na+ symporter
VSAGLLTFPQELGLVFGANVGTTGTGWLVALVGVRVSLSAYALPMIFVGALVKLLGGGRIAAAGAALAGFALVLFGLTTLQEGMGGLAERLHPSIGQNIGTATSSAMAAIGASTTAKRLAVAYVLFKAIAAVIALVVFPITIPLIIRASKAVDGVTPLAAYHTVYNAIGVLVLMPVIDWFTRFVERLLPDRTSPLTRCLDPAGLANTVVAIEAVRRTVARVIEAICGSIRRGSEGDVERRNPPDRQGRRTGDGGRGRVGQSAGIHVGCEWSAADSRRARARYKHAARARSCDAAR